MTNTDIDVDQLVSDMESAIEAHVSGGGTLSINPNDLGVEDDRFEWHEGEQKLVVRALMDVFDVPWADWPSGTQTCLAARPDGIQLIGESIDISADWFIAPPDYLR